MEGYVRQHRPDGPDQAQILDDDAVGPQVGGQLGSLHRGLDLPVVHQGIQRHIDLAAPDPAVAHGLFKFLVGKIPGAAAGVEIPHSQIYGVRSVLYGGDHRFRRSRRRKKLDHISVSFRRAWSLRLFKNPVGIISL